MCDKLIMVNNKAHYKIRLKTEQEWPPYAVKGERKEKNRRKDTVFTRYRFRLTGESCTDSDTVTDSG